jgi:hypothetical protein
VVAAVIAAIFSPAMGMAKTQPAATEPVRQVASTTVALANALAATAQAKSTEATQYAQREEQSQPQGVQDFRGGAVYLYFGSGVVLALIIIILLLI